MCVYGEGSTCTSKVRMQLQNQRTLELEGTPETIQSKLFLPFILQREMEAQTDEMTQPELRRQLMLELRLENGILANFLCAFSIPASRGKGDAI